MFLTRLTTRWQSYRQINSQITSEFNIIRLQEDIRKTHASSFSATRVTAQCQSANPDIDIFTTFSRHFQAGQIRCDFARRQSCKVTANLTIDFVSIRRQLSETANCRHHPDSMFRFYVKFYTALTLLDGRLKRHPAWNNCATMMQMVPFRMSCSGKWGDNTKSDSIVNMRSSSLHCALSLAAQCTVIGPVYGFVCLFVFVGLLTR